MYIKKVAYSYTYTHKRPQEAGVFTCLEGCADGWTDGRSDGGKGAQEKQQGGRTLDPRTGENRDGSEGGRMSSEVRGKREADGEGERGRSTRSEGGCIM